MVRTLGKENRTDGRVTRAERQRRERRESVLAAARRVFSAKGYHAASITDILETADIARGTFYLYFESKRAVFDELLDSYFDHLREQVRTVDVSPGAQPPLDQMREIVSHVLETLIRDGDLTMILLHEAMGIDTEFDAKVGDFYGRILELIQSALVTGQEIGLVRPLDPMMTSYCILGSVKELVDHLISSAQAGKPPDLDASTDALVNYNLSGVFLSQ
jgi:AcrR family transcriptional regulator